MMNNKIVGITCSTFDLLHTGHIIMLEECKKHCDYLICALQNDPTIDRKDKNKPIQSLVERYLQLDAVKYVDKIIPYNDEEELEELFSSLDLDVRIIGEDYKDKIIQQKVFAKRGGLELYTINVIIITQQQTLEKKSMMERVKKDLLIKIWQ